MNVALADINPEPLNIARDAVAAFGGKTIAIPVDVSDRTAMADAAARVAAEWGDVHVLVNNAGVVAGRGSVLDVSDQDWDWLIGVNLRGVINGMACFVPAMRAHGQPGHVVNNASIGGMQVRPNRGTGAYAMTKYGVVALTEALEQELTGTPLGVSVLCPAAVATHIYQASLNRPPRFGGPYEHLGIATGRDLLAGGLPPDAVGERVLSAIQTGEFFIFTHPETREWLETRYRRIIDGYAALDRYQQTTTTA
jgi:NAD(P)-dependent dehydrogenase (short-subunit alcohol dehydrogenase family)